MDFFFADDSYQKNPSRNGVNPLLAIGGIQVPGNKVADLERAIQAHCESVGFPPKEKFKWSPSGDEKFQKLNLIGSKRMAFFTHLLELAQDHGARATVVITDTNCRFARKQSKSHEEDANAIFLERCDWAFQSTGGNGCLIVATPSGGPKDERKFVSGCIELIRSGTEYMKLKSMPLGVITAQSRNIRLLQVADVIVSCTVARISGESNFSPIVWPKVKELLRSDGTRIGGVGLKLHPDFRYANLYHWLLGDSHWRKGILGLPLPRQGIPFFQSAGEAVNSVR